MGVLLSAGESCLALACHQKSAKHFFAITIISSEPPAVCTGWLLPAACVPRRCQMSVQSQNRHSEDFPSLSRFCIIFF